MLLLIVLFGVGQILFAADREVLVCDAKALEAFDHREVSINAIWSVSLDSESFEGAFCDPTKRFVKKGFRYDPETMRGNGFGSNGQNPWALVLRSVSNLHSCAKWR